MINRLAVRFLMNHQDGELLIHDPNTFATYVRPVTYFPEKDCFMTCLPKDSIHVDLIQDGGVCALHVATAHSAGGPLIDRHGIALPSAILHVHADVQASIVTQLADVGRILSRIVPSNHRRMTWVGVSMQLLRQKTRFRDEMMSRQISA
jgi:hypothetical protein